MLERINARQEQSKLYEERLEYRPTRFIGRATFDELIEHPFAQVQEGSTIISVLNGARFQFTNSSPISVTELTDAQDGQMIALLGDGNTTLVDNSRLVLGSNTLLEDEKVFLLTYLDGAWYPLLAGSGVQPIAAQDYSTSSSVSLTSQATQIDAYTNAGNVTLTLPAAASVLGKIVYIAKLSAANTLTVEAAPGEFINAGSDISWTTQYQSYTLIARAAGDWRIV